MAAPAEEAAAPRADGTAADAVLAGPRRGRVVSFDPGRGLGEVEGEGGVRYPFHATAVADGSRRVEVGATVTYQVEPGNRGRYEARSLAAVLGDAAAS